MPVQSIVFGGMGVLNIGNFIVRLDMYEYFN